jgi:hypothetical protein
MDIIVKKNSDANDDTEERREMYMEQSHAFQELIDKWVKGKMPKGEIVALIAGDKFMVSVLLNDSCEIRSAITFDRKKNLAATREENRKIIAEWLRAAFATGSAWSIQNFEILPDEEFTMHEFEE